MPVAACIVEESRLPILQSFTVLSLLVTLVVTIQDDATNHSLRPFPAETNLDRCGPSATYHAGTGPKSPFYWPAALLACK